MLSLGCDEWLWKAWGLSVQGAQSSWKGEEVAVPGEVMGEETKVPPCHPTQPDLECDRCRGHLDRCLFLMRMQKLLGNRLCGTSTA